MTIEWFGWLTKPHMLMKGLDSVIMVGEAVTVIFGAAFIDYLLGYK